MEQVATAAPTGTPRINGVPCMYPPTSAAQVADATTEPAQVDQQPEAKPKRARGAGPWYLVAVVATTVSVDTSWRFFADVLDIPEDTGERWIMFAVLELVLFACGWSMRAAVRRNQRPGPERVIAWAVCGMSAYMALALSGPERGIARVLLGPVAAVIALHRALGVEISVASGKQAVGTIAKVGVELRERALSRLGLANDQRDAATRTADRALHRAANLATQRQTRRRTRRLRKAVRMSGATTDPRRRRQLVTETAALRHVADLATTEWRSPWLSDDAAMSDIMSDTDADRTSGSCGHEASVSAVQTACSSDMSADVVSDIRADAALVDASISPRRSVRHSTPTTRTSRPSPRGQDTRSRVGRLVAKTPDITAGDVATRLGISERQALRHLTAIRETNGA